MKQSKEQNKTLQTNTVVLTAELKLTKITHFNPIKGRVVNWLHFAIQV